MIIDRIGVAFLIFVKIDGLWKLLTIQELEDKPELHKKAGMLSVPMETFKPSDICPRNTLPRLLEEECGISSEDVGGVHLCHQVFCPIPCRPDIPIFYGIGLYRGPLDRTFQPGDDDIRFVGWLTHEELLREECRPGVREILEHFHSRYGIEFLEAISNFL